MYAVINFLMSYFPRFRQAFSGERFLRIRFDGCKPRTAVDGISKGTLGAFGEGGRVPGSSDGKTVLICKSHADYPLDRVLPNVMRSKEIGRSIHVFVEGNGDDCNGENDQSDCDDKQSS